MVTLLPMLAASAPDVTPTFQDEGKKKGKNPLQEMCGNVLRPLPRSGAQHFRLSPMVRRLV